MINLERWYDELMYYQWVIALHDGEPCKCGSVPCDDCYFKHGFFESCTKNKWWWLWEDGEVCCLDEF